MRILVGRRHETMGSLAVELGVTDRTIRSDINVLTVDYPLDTVRGNGGCVKVADWYHPHKNILSQEQQTVLIQLLDKSDRHQNKILREMLAAFGTSAKREEYAKNEKR
jgi:transcriptional antiterminator